MLIAIVTAGCGGEGQTGTVVGPAGGTVSGPNGAKVVIPPGALTTEVTINIEQTSDGAPALPGGFSTSGPMFAFTPHGTGFAVSVTVTLPWDPASVPAGKTPALYKTNAQNQWELVANATFDVDRVTAQVTSFSFFQITPTVPNDLTRKWEFTWIPGNGQPEVPVPGGSDTQVGGNVDEIISFGPAVLDGGIVRFNESLPPDGFANGFVFSTENGVTYGVMAEAPYARLGGPEPIGSVTRLKQTQSFIKRRDDAFLRFTVSRVYIDVRDFGAPFLTGVAPLKGEVLLAVQAYMTPDSDAGVAPNAFFYTAGRASVLGGNGSFFPSAKDESFSRSHLWGDENFDFRMFDTAFFPGGEDFSCPGTAGELTLREPLHYTVDLSSVAVEGEFTLRIDTFAETYNRRGGGAVSDCQGSAAQAYLRDPLEFGGLTLTFDGLEPTNNPQPSPPDQVLVAPAACVPGPGPDPAAGTLQFDAGSYSIDEFAGAMPTITVTRTGGSKGAVTATFTASDGTAVAGTDYTPVHATVFFADGDSGQRVVNVPIIQDLLLEPDKTVNLTLSEPGGCAALGTPTTAMLTIRDDDPLPLPSHTVGGTVTGLVGTGLVLTSAGLNLSPGNGPFTFPQPLPVGIPYNVMIDSQPTNPNQVCTVTNGSGTIGDADVTNVAVDCVTLPTNGALDPSFGSGGKVTGPGGASGMALQASDGKIVVVGGRSLSRYNTDGSPDTSFGAGGVVAVVFTGAFDDARAVAIQPDGKIVVAGVTRGAAQNDFGDFAVARYDGDGNLDTSFGTGGKVTTDFHAGSDEASAVRIQTDGRIVVAGSAAASSSFPVDNDFAVARYTGAGILDAGFGTGGKVSTNVAGRTDLVNAAVLSSDGKIVLAGRVADGSATEPDLCLVRYQTDGSPDMGFGNNGVVRTDLGLGNWEEATDLVMQPDGKIVVAALVVIDGKFSFGVARFDAAGALDGTFATGGVATSAFPAQDDYANAVAMQPDGKIVVAGRSPQFTTSDFAIARFDATGMLDGSFGTGGKVTVDFFGGSDGAESVAVQPDGKIVVAGFGQNGSNGLALARLNP